jgi:TolA-binding protein
VLHFILHYRAFPVQELARSCTMNIWGWIGMFRRFLAVALCVAPAAFCADKSILELQRDVAALQEQVRGLQKSLDDKLADLAQKQAEQTRAAADQAVRSLASIGDRMQKSLQDRQDQESKNASAMAGMGARLQGLAGDVGTIKDSLADLNTALAKLATQLSDLGNAVKTMQTPVTPPSGQATPDPNAPQISASDLTSSAERDRSGGSLDLALQEYRDFLKWYPNDAQASEAQYRIGWIQYSLKHWDEAAASFDQVVEHYPESNRIAESLFYKGKSLVELGRRPEANEAFKLLRQRFPGSPLAKESTAIKPTTGK